MKESAINYFKLQALMHEIGKQRGALAGAMAYTRLAQAVEEYGRVLLNDYPDLRSHVSTIGLTNISKKMIDSYKA